LEEVLLETTKAVGKSVIRIDALDKVTGRVKFNNDVIIPGILYAKMVISQYAHAEINYIDISQAASAPGVQAVITGEYVNGVLTGTFVEDRPPIAVGKVRYFGEPIALVVANSEREAAHAAQMVQVEYEPLPLVHSPSDAVKTDAPLVHEKLAEYKHVEPTVYPEPNTNIAHRVKIRKGDMAKGWAESQVVVEGSYTLPKSDHIAMETRNVKAQIHPDGQVLIETSSQSPFAVKKDVSRHFGVEEGLVIVKTPLVGGGFGGKAPVQLEFLAYIASKAVGGRPVKIANSREEDIVSSPCKLGLEAKINWGLLGMVSLKLLK
jgi:CO/xanthine dehydrogenase Mo-binding subunit